MPLDESEPSTVVDSLENAPADEPAENTSLSPRAEAALDRVRVVSRVLDNAVRIPFTNFRIGIDPVLGIVPGAGDAIAAILSLYPIVEAYRLKAPRTMLLTMVTMVAVDAAVGSIPVFGPLFDAVWKANEWNLNALERHLVEDH